MAWKRRGRRGRGRGRKKWNKGNKKEKSYDFVGGKRPYKGKIQFVNFKKGFGWITPFKEMKVDGETIAPLKKDDKEGGIFVFKSELNGDVRSYKPGTKVSFKLTKNDKGFQAVKVKFDDETTARRTGVVTTGTVIGWNFKGKFGFIKPDTDLESLNSQAKIPWRVREMNNGNVYVSAQQTGGHTLRKGQKVEFELYFDQKGVGAVEVGPVSQPAPALGGLGGLGLGGGGLLSLLGGGGGLDLGSLLGSASQDTGYGPSRGGGWKSKRGGGGGKKWWSKWSKAERVAWNKKNKKKGRRGRKRW